VVPPGAQVASVAGFHSANGLLDRPKRCLQRPVIGVSTGRRHKVVRPPPVGDRQQERAQAHNSRESSHGLPHPGRAAPVACRIAPRRLAGSFPVGLRPGTAVALPGDSTAVGEISKYLSRSGEVAGTQGAIATPSDGPSSQVSGKKPVTHARYVTFQMAEVPVPERLFRAIPARIRRLPMPETMPG